MGELGFFRGERVELIRGVVMNSPPLGPAHANIVQRLADVFLPRLLGRATVRIRQPFLAWDDSEPEPDLAVVPPGSYAERHPDRASLVVEVADASLEYDRKKGPLYAASHVAEYWVVDIAGRTIEIHTHPVGGEYAKMRRAVVGWNVTPSAFPEMVMPVRDLIG